MIFSCARIASKFIDLLQLCIVLGSLIIVSLKVSDFSHKSFIVLTEMQKKASLLVYPRIFGVHYK